MIDRRASVIVGAYAAGDLAARLPNTTAGFICGLCVAFLVGVCARRLLDRWSGA